MSEDTPGPKAANVIPRKTNLDGPRFRDWIPEGGEGSGMIPVTTDRFRDFIPDTVKADEEPVIRCGFCDWSVPPEKIEKQKSLKMHMRRVHGL